MDLRLCVVKSCLLAFLVGALSSGVCINCMPNLLRLVLNQTLGTVVGVHTKHTGKDAGHVYGPKDLVCAHESVSYVVGYLHFGKAHG